MGSKSLFCFRKSEICILNTVSTEVTLAPSNLAFSGSILHILFSSSRHCLTFTCGHQKRFTNGNVWTRINLKTDKYLSVFKFIRIRVDGALIGSLTPLVNRAFCPLASIIKPAERKTNYVKFCIKRLLLCFRGIIG